MLGAKEIKMSVDSLITPDIKINLSVFILSLIPMAIHLYLRMCNSRTFDLKRDAVL